MLALYWQKRFAIAFAVSILALGFSAPAHSGALGLTAGDEVSFLEFDALRSVPGDGGSFDFASQIFTGEGRITSLVTVGSGAIAQGSNVEFNFNLDFVSESLAVFGNLLTFNTVLQTPGLGHPGPDFTITEGGIDVLFGNFISGVVLTGNINIAANSAAVVTQVGLLGISGGDAALVAALGGVGTGVLLQTATVFDFEANLLALLASGEVWDSDFSASISGLLTPVAAVPFVPEPATAVLLGGGLIGLLGIARRVRR